MKVRDLAVCPSCRRIVAVRGGRLERHAKRLFAWNVCSGSGQVLA